GGKRPRSRRRRLFLLDQRRLQADTHALDLIGLDAVFQPRQLAQRQVERALSPLVGGAGVTEDTGTILVGLVTRRNGVAQAVLLAHLGEQPGAHAAVQDVDRSQGVVILRVAARHALVRDADLGLRGLLRDVLILA